MKILKTMIYDLMIINLKRKKKLKNERLKKCIYYNSNIYIFFTIFACRFSNLFIFLFENLYL